MHLGGIAFISHRANITLDMTKGVLLQRAIVQCLWRVDVTSGKVDIVAAFFLCGRCITSIGFAVVPPPSHLGFPDAYQISCFDLVDCGIVFGSLCTDGFVLTSMILASLENIHGGYVYWDSTGTDCSTMSA